MFRIKQLLFFAGLLIAWNPAIADISNQPNPYAPGFGFDKPNEAVWGGWSRTDDDALYAEWDIFVDTSYPGERTSAPDVGSTAGSKAHIGWNGGTFEAGSGNLYSFSVVEKFTVKMTDNTPNSGPVRAALQFETWGMQMNYGSILLNGLQPTVSKRTFYSNDYPSSFGAVEFVQYLVYWDLAQGVQDYAFSFSGGTSMSLGQVAVDIGTLNQAPVAQAGSDQTIGNGGKTRLDGLASADPDGTLSAYAWTQTAGPAVNILAANTATPSFTAPIIGVDTLLQFSLVVTDDKGLASSADTVNVLVTSNYAPIADAGMDRSVPEASTVSLSGTGSDTDGSVVAYQWTQVAGPAVSLSGADTPNPQFTAPSLTADGNLEFRLVVIDDDGASSDADTLSITVCNREESGCKPTASAGTDHSALVGEVVVLDGTNSHDPQNQTLSYEWLQVAGPAVSLSDVHSAQPEFVVPVVSVNTPLSFKLIVTDSDGNISDAALVNIIINVVNTAPVAEAPAVMAIRAGATLVLDGSASYDPESDQLSYIWQQTGGPALSLSNSFAKQPTAVVPLSALGQTLIFKLTVSDGLLQSSEKTISVNVNANSAPVLNMDSQLLAAQNKEVALHATAQDPDGDNLQFVWEQIQGGSVALIGADTAELRFTTSQLAPGTSELLAFRLTVSDGFGAGPLSVGAEMQVIVTSDGTGLDCSLAAPSRTALWPANKGFKAVNIIGVTGPNPYDLIIESITQDEPVVNKALKDTTGRDAKIVKPKATRKKPRVRQSMLLRAERQGIKKKYLPFSGNGRIYTIRFQANDTFQTCHGVVTVQVPPNKGETAVLDTAGEFDSTQR